MGRLLSALSPGLLIVVAQLFGQSEQLQVTVSRGIPTVISVRVPYNFNYSASKPGTQGRLVVDISKTNKTEDVDEGLRSIPVGNRLVKEVLIGAFKPGTTRLVIVLADTSAQASLTVSRLRRNGGLQIQVRESVPPPPEEGASSKSAPATPAPKSQAKLQTRTQPGPSPSPPLPRPRTVETPQPVQSVPPLRAFHLPARIGIVKEVALSLPEALHLAIANNPDFQAARVDVEQAGYKILGASSVYVPNFNWLGTYARQTLLVNSPLDGSSTGSVLNRWWQTRPSFTGLAPRLGGNYEVSFAGQRYTTDRTFATYNPSYPSVLSVRYAQPLWRNLRYDSNRYSVEVARKNREMTSETLRLRITQVIFETEQAYWELVFARSEVAVQLQALETARTQEESNRRQQVRGLVNPIDIISSQTQVTNFEIALYTAQEALTRAENSLKNLILGDRVAALWDSALNPTSAPETDFVGSDLADLVNEALIQRPESAQLEIAGQINKAGERLRREQGKPQLDVIATYARSSLAGTPVNPSSVSPRVESQTASGQRSGQLSPLGSVGAMEIAPGVNLPGTMSSVYGRSLNDLFNRDFPATEIQLSISIPLSNRAVRANVEESLAEARRLGFKKKSVGQAIESEVRNALQGIDSAHQRLQAARAHSQSAAEQFKNELSQFERGASTLFLLQQRQLTMVMSTSLANRAATDLSQAISLLELARGANYQRHNIVVK